MPETRNLQVCPTCTRETATRLRCDQGERFKGPGVVEPQYPAGQPRRLKGSGAVDQLQLPRDISTYYAAIGAEFNPNLIMVLIFIVGFILSRLCGRIPKKKTFKGEVVGKGAERDREFCNNVQKISERKKQQNKKSSLSKKGIGPKKAIKIGGGKG